jgi:hypothetical protein
MLDGRMSPSLLWLYIRLHQLFFFRQLHIYQDDIIYCICSTCTQCATVYCIYNENMASTVHVCLHNIRQESGAVDQEKLNLRNIPWNPGSKDDSQKYFFAVTVCNPG